jgi:hypothetical protein
MNAVLSQTLCQREPHLKTCIPRFRVDLNIAPVLFHNSLNRVEAKARTLANSLGGEKGFEDMRLYFGRNSWTVVGDLDHDTVVLAIGSNSNLALATHGVNGVVNCLTSAEMGAK